MICIKFFVLPYFLLSQAFERTDRLKLLRDTSVLLCVQGIRGADVGSVNTWPAAVSSAHKHGSVTVREKWWTVRSAGHLSRRNVSVCRLFLLYIHDIGSLLRGCIYDKTVLIVLC